MGYVGVNDRTRRAAQGDDADAPDQRERATAFLGHALAETGWDRRAAGRHARWFTSPGGPVPPAVMVAAVDAALLAAVQRVLRTGWGPSDLGEISRRRLSPEHLPLLVALLAAEAAPHPGHLVAAGWLAELAALGPGSPPDLLSAPQMERALGVAAVLGTLPPVQPLMAPPGVRDEAPHAAMGSDAKQLARVRALLAKAESTHFPEEAEALSAKAQELISRYALDRLAAEAAAPTSSRGATVLARRLWIDAPYVRPKAMLVASVARANRCSSVVQEQLGFCTVVGAATDLDAVELLTTSLMVQAGSALVGTGQRKGWDGTSRTTSFRRSFLVSYATRIGERLRAADHEVAEASGRAGELMPLVRAREEEVAAAIAQMFPAAVRRETTVSNMAGWAEGRAAADLARFDSTRAVTPPTTPPPR